MAGLRKLAVLHVALVSAIAGLLSLPVTSGTAGGNSAPGWGTRPAPDTHSIESRQTAGGSVRTDHQDLAARCQSIGAPPAGATILLRTEGHTAPGQQTFSALFGRAPPRNS